MFVLYGDDTKAKGIGNYWNEKFPIMCTDIVKILGKDVTSLTDLTYAYNSGKASGFNVTGKLNDTMLDVDDVLAYLTLLKH